MKKIVFMVVLIIVTMGCLSLPTTSYAQITNQGVFDQATTRFQNAAQNWETEIFNAARWLFGILMTISLAWTFGIMALKKADLQEFFAEFVKFCLFFGFFFWLLLNGSGFATDIINSFSRLAGNAGGIQSASASGVVDVGFKIFDTVLKKSSFWNMDETIMGGFLAILLLIVLTLVAINILLVKCSGWILIYAGLFFLGFGGSKWTSDMAINYFKQVLSVAVQLMTMYLVVGIGNDFLQDYYNNMEPGINFTELGVMLVVGLIILAIVNKVPTMISSMVTGGMAGGGATGAGVGGMGAGAMLAGGAAAGAAIATGGTSLAVGSGGGISAVKEAMKAAGVGGGGSGEDIGGGSKFDMSEKAEKILSSQSGGNSGGGGEMGPLAQATGTGKMHAPTGGFGAGSGEGLTGGSTGEIQKDSGGDSSESVSETGEQSGNTDTGGDSGQDGEIGDGGSEVTEADNIGDVSGSGGDAGEITGGNQDQSDDSSGKPVLPKDKPFLWGAGSTAGKMAKTGKILAEGTGKVAKDAISDRVARTTGGKVASAIRSRHQTEGQDE